MKPRARKQVIKSKIKKNASLKSFCQLFSFPLPFDKVFRPELSMRPNSSPFFSFFVDFFLRAFDAGSGGGDLITLRSRWLD